MAFAWHFSKGEGREICLLRRGKEERRFGDTFSHDTLLLLLLLCLGGGKKRGAQGRRVRGREGCVAKDEVGRGRGVDGARRREGGRER